MPDYPDNVHLNGLDAGTSVFDHPSVTESLLSLYDVQRLPSADLYPSAVIISNYEDPLLAVLSVAVCVCDGGILSGNGRRLHVAGGAVKITGSK